MLCRLLGHRDVPARRRPGLAWWEQCEPTDSRGVGCTRCRRYLEHVWVGIARDATGREP